VSAVAACVSTSSTPTDADRPLTTPDVPDPDLIAVGHVARAHGVRGEVAVEVRSDVPERRFAVGNVLLTDHPDAPTLTIASARPHSGRLLVTFAEVLDRNVAEALQGTVLLIDPAEAGSASEDAADEAWWDSDLIGLQARTVSGAALGEVVDVQHNPGGELLVIAREGASELLVPFVSAIVPVVDVQAGEVVVDPPPGLLEL
jgi:16S rRNA processing protein RimM